MNVLGRFWATIQANVEPSEHQPDRIDQLRNVIAGQLQKEKKTEIELNHTNKQNSDENKFLIN